MSFLNVIGGRITTAPPPPPRSVGREMASPEAPRPVLRAGVLELHRPEARVTLGGAAVALTRTEFLLLAALMERPGDAVSRPELARVSPGAWAAKVGKPITENLYTLRAKLRRAAEAAGVAPPVIETVRQFGYRLRA